MNNNPFLIIAAKPIEATRIKDLYLSGNDSIMEMMLHPKTLRRAGWDLIQGIEPKIYKGECLEIRTTDDQTERLYEDGSFIVRVPADYRFLAWGTKAEENFTKDPRLNPLALIEFIYNYMVFYSQLLSKMDNTVKNIRFIIRLKNMHIDGVNLYVVPYPIDSISWSRNSSYDKKSAPENDMSRDIQISTEEISKNPNVSAFKIAQEIYLWFGIEPNKIPYIIEKDGLKQVDVSAISKIGG